VPGEASGRTRDISYRAAEVHDQSEDTAVSTTTRDGRPEPPETGMFQASRGIVVILLLVIPLSRIGLDVHTPVLPKIAIEFAASNDLVRVPSSGGHHWR
jgi:hypothetical protein